jgi:hypothetical protein
VKIKFKTNYLLGRNPLKAGDIVDVPEPLVRYLVEDLGVAELIREGDKGGKGEG